MYKCKRCGYSTEYKSNLKNHFKRKKICPPLYSDISIETLKQQINQKLIKSDNLINLIKNESKMNPNESKMDSINRKMNPNESKMNPK